MEPFDKLVQSLEKAYEGLLKSKLSGASGELDWLAVGAEDQALYLHYRLDGEETLVSLLDRGLGDAETDAYDIAGYHVVDFDAVEYDSDFWSGREFIVQCALPFVALALERRLRAGRYAVGPSADFQVGVFDDINACRVQAYAPTYYLDMPEDEFLSEFDQHCNQERYVEFVQHVLEGGWTGDSIALARSVTSD